MWVPATVDKSVSIAVIPSNKFNSVALDDTATSEPDVPIYKFAVLNSSICLLEFNTTALLAVAVPAVTSTKFNSAVDEVQPSNMLSSSTSNVAPARIFNSAVVDVTPSSLFNSAAEEVTWTADPLTPR